MKATCTQENLRHALRCVERVAGRHVSLPILENILLETEKGRLKVSATNLELGIVDRVNAKVERDGRVALPAKIVSDFVSNLPSENSIVIELLDGEVSFESGSYHAKIKNAETEEFPIIPYVEKKDLYWKFQSQELKEMLSRLLVCVSPNDARIEFTGIFMEYVDGRIEFAATDSFRLAQGKASIQEEMREKEENSFIVPAQAVSELIKLIEPSTESVSIGLSGGQVFFEIESDVYLVSRLINGNFPDYRQIIPNSFSTTVVVDVQELSRAARLAGMFSQSQTSEVRIQIKPDSRELVLESESSRYGVNTSSLEALKIDGEPQNIVFNPRYILDALGMQRGQKIGLFFNDDTSPAAFRGVDEQENFREDFQYILMPIKK